MRQYYSTIRDVKKNIKERERKLEQEMKERREKLEDMKKEVLEKKMEEVEIDNKEVSEKEEKEEPVAISAFAHLDQGVLKTLRGLGRWNLLEETNHSAKYSTLCDSMILDISLGFPLPPIQEGNFSVKHWKIRSMELQNPSPLLKRKNPDTFCALAHRLILKQIKSDSLESECPTTHELGKTLLKLYETMTAASQFISDCRILDANHFQFAFKDFKTSVGFVNIHLKTDFYVQFNLADAFMGKVTEIEIIPGSPRVKWVPREEILQFAKEVPSGWRYLKNFIGKIDNLLKTCELADSKMK